MKEGVGSGAPLGWWERYLDSIKGSYPRVYLGTYVALTGGLLGVVSWLLYFWSFASDATLWTVREAAFATGPLALALVLLGFVSLLTTAHRRLSPLVPAATWSGFVGCLGGLWVFVYAYPSAWNVPGTDYSLVGVSLFGVGIGLMFLAGVVAVGYRRSTAARQ